MTDKTPQQLLNEAVAKIDNAVADAIEIADEHGLEFTLDIAYGAGCTYYPPQYLQSEDGEWLVEEYYLDAESGGWVSSSQTC